MVPAYLTVPESGYDACLNHPCLAHQHRPRHTDQFSAQQCPARRNSVRRAPVLDRLVTTHILNNNSRVLRSSSTPATTRSWFNRTKILSRGWHHRPVYRLCHAIQTYRGKYLAGRPASAATLQCFGWITRCTRLSQAGLRRQTAT